jgi:Fe-S-cluster containining protein
MTQSFSLFGTNLFGESAKIDKQGIIHNKYKIPPFSVLNTSDRFWVSRKKQWLKLGIKSELGRNAKSYNTSKWVNEKGLSGGAKNFIGTSIFDPVLCELMCSWFCPVNGQIIDPFAGGSVRGVVACLLGYKYWGCDLSEEQIIANKENFEEVVQKINQDFFVKIKISSKSMNQKFVKCEEEYIVNNCKGRCCEGSDRILVTVHKSEQLKFEEKGAKVEGGFLVPVNGLCPFKTKKGLCNTHKDKPFGCRVSPFTLNTNNTLIVRNRYRSLKCFRRTDIKKYPVYISHKQSLIFLFGKTQYKKIVRFSKKEKDCYLKIEYNKYKMLLDNDFQKNKKEPKILLPNGLNWIIGDSEKEIQKAPQADFIFTCPPYGNLEVYSNKEEDLSNKDYKTFLLKYRKTIINSLNKLKPNSFACFVVSDFRDKKTGFYNTLVKDTVDIFHEQGVYLYNEFILVTSIGSLQIRISKQFDKSKKNGKRHQNVLVFYKGDPNNIKEMEFIK